MEFLFEIGGVVRQGKKRGKKLGFPTANIALNQPVPEGIYVSQTIIKGQEYQSVSFIGKAQTFNETIPQAESYILDFNEVLYGKEITIRLLKKIRESKKFTSEKELIDAMQNDVKEALEFFQKISSVDES